MEGPTPVSALIHAATMVTAGIYFLLRLSYILILSPIMLNFLIVLGALTAFICALVATVQFDIKKIIAYSTCSQLGYMVLSIGLANFQGSFYHLINHAFFKALLFLTAGAIIHSLSGEQDIRKMGGLFQILPFYYFCVIISSLSMVGCFFFSGFYSKEHIINSFNFYSATTSILFSY
jgi:NADH:ubiquinone oxidoreductase subunit 5 (subunit L)/multisubunit Na+/H+ antiporter MnhA subunit